MKFEKLKLKEIINENTNQVDYLINNKYVTKEVYEKIDSDDSLYVLPPLPKVKNSPENNSKISLTTNTKQINIQDYSDENEECNCPECQELMLIINDIREMDDNEAKEMLGGYIEAIKIENQMETMIRVYNEIGNNLLKNSLKIEDQLNDFISQFESGNGDED